MDTEKHRSLNVNAAAGEGMGRRIIQKVAEEFEEEIRAFLKRCGFRDVAGGRDFRLKEQIDVCAGFEVTLIIVECKTGPKSGKPLLDEIKIPRGKMAAIIEGAKSYEVYSKYTNYSFAIAASFEIRAIDEGEAQTAQRVFLWDRVLIEYYEGLFGRTGEYTKFNFLGELEVRPRIEHSIQLPCFRIPIKSTNLYLFFSEPKELLKWSYVGRPKLKHPVRHQRTICTFRDLSFAPPRFSLFKIPYSESRELPIHATHNVPGDTLSSDLVAGIS